MLTYSSFRRCASAIAESKINLSGADGMSYAGEGVPMGKKAPVKIGFAKGKDKKGQESDKMIDVSLDLGGQTVSESCKK